MAIRKVRTKEETQKILGTNDGFDTMFPNSKQINQILNNNDDAISMGNEEISDAENIEENNRIQELIKYESKDDFSPVLRTSKNDDELKNDLTIKIAEKKVLTADEYQGRVVDVSIEEIMYPESEKYKRVRISLEIMNDDPVEPVLIDLTANLNLNFNSKLLRIVRAIVGYEVTGTFNLKSLIDKKIIVKTKIITDKYGDFNHAIDVIKKG